MIVQILIYRIHSLSEPHHKQEETQSDTPAQTAEQTSNNDGASQSAANTYQPAIERNTLNGDNELTSLQVHNSLTSRIEETEK